MIMSAAVDPVLRVWKASAFLERRRIAFRFRDAEVIDRNSPKGDFVLARSDHATVTVGRSSRLRGASRDRLGANAEAPAFKTGNLGRRTRVACRLGDKSEIHERGT
jgi:hypothetical protein